jgi:hypothetical protein
MPFPSPANIAAAHYGLLGAFAQILVSLPMIGRNSAPRLGLRINPVAKQQPDGWQKPPCCW